MNLSGKTIIVTGASDGIGKQVALKLSVQKCNLVLIARADKKLADVAKEILTVKTYPCDIKNTAELTTTIKKITADFGSFDGLVNVAGIWQKLMPLEEISAEVVDDVITTNLTALIHTTRLCLPMLKSQPEAVIINVSSKSGMVAQAGQSVYTASKFGVRGFTEVLKVDLKDTKVRVAGVYQSGTNTQMFAKTGETFDTNKLTDPADLAEAIVFMMTRPAKIWLHEIKVEY